MGMGIGYSYKLCLSRFRRLRASSWCLLMSIMAYSFGFGRQLEAIDDGDGC